MKISKQLRLILIVAMIASLPCVLRAGVVGTAEAVRLRVNDAYGKLPMTFEMNQGQTDPQVRFLARGGGYMIFLTPTEAIVRLHTGIATVGKGGGVALLPSRLPPQAQEHAETRAFAKSRAQDDILRIQFVGADPNARAEGIERLEGHSNYFIGKDPSRWKVGIPNFAKVRFQAVYPGVDLIYYGNQRALEYDFVLRPGANPKQVRMAFDGATNLRIDSNGDLVIGMPVGEMRHCKPSAYQAIGRERRIVDAHYVLKDDKSVSLEFGAYRQDRDLSVDPVLSYSTYLGGSYDEFLEGIAVDASGNAYFVGGTESADFPLAGPLQGSMACSWNSFVTKLNATGSALVYSTYLGGTSDSGANGIAVDGSGNAYVTGGTRATDFPTVNALQATYGGGSCDGFVAKLNAAGSALLYSTYLGGSGTEIGFGMAVDGLGNACVIGETNSPDLPTANPVQASYGGGTYDAFVAKLNTVGSSLVYSTYLGGSGSDIGWGIAADGAGNAYATGDTTSTNFPTANSLQARYGGGGADAFVAKLNAAGSALVYSTYLGGSEHEQGIRIAADGAGNAYVTGSTGSPDFPIANPLQWSRRGDRDAFITKLNPAGSTLVYSTYLGGTGVDSGLGIAVDGSGDVYVTGATRSTDFPTANPLQGGYGGGVFDAFVTKLNAAGSALVFSTQLGGCGYDYGVGIAVDGSGSAYVTGSTGSTNFPTANPLQASSAGEWDAFVARIDPTGCMAPWILTQPASQTIASGSTAALTVVALGTSPFTHQWYQGATGDTSAPVGTSSNSYTTLALTATTNYWVRVTDPCGVADSNTATVTVNCASGVIITGITSKTSKPGSTATIWGTGFSNTAKNNTVKFGNLTAAVKKATPTKITTTIPKKCKKGRTYQVVVTVTGKGTSNAWSFTVK